MKFAFTIALAAIILGGCSKRPHQSQAHPKDAELMDRFAANRTELEAIVGIFRSCPEIEILDDKGFRHREKMQITCQIPWPYQSGHSELLQRLVVKQVFKRADGNIGFLVSEEGSIYCPGSGKGYEYVETKSEKPVDSLETIDGDIPGFHLRHIDGKWHLFLHSYCT